MQNLCIFTVTSSGDLASTKLDASDDLASTKPDASDVLASTKLDASGVSASTKLAQFWLGPAALSKSQFAFQLALREFPFRFFPRPIRLDY